MVLADTLMRFSLYPIHWVAKPYLDPEPFDHNLLPFEVTEGVRIEALADRFRSGTFDLHRRHIGEDLTRILERVQYGIVHRYNPEPVLLEGKFIGEVQRNEASEKLVREIVACLRLIRPMRQHALMMRGTIRDEDGSFDVTGLDVPNLWLHEVPEVQKLWSLRNRDCHDLRLYAPEFLKAMRGEFWKFRMAVQFHELGFFQSHPEEWKTRLLMWASAIESIYTTNSPGHRARRSQPSESNGSSARTHPFTPLATSASLRKTRTSPSAR